jgi:hypothetical protein
VEIVNDIEYVIADEIAIEVAIENAIENEIAIDIGIATVNETATNIQNEMEV